MTRHALNRPLPAVLRTRAERFYEADLSRVRLRCGNDEREPASLARTYGDTIQMSAAALVMPARALLELLGHELAHVVQQRQERVPTRWDPVLGDRRESVHLEQEAMRAGRRFAARRTSSGFRGTVRRWVRRPALQCAVAVGGETVGSPGALSEKSRKILALIPSGLEWLAWAIGNPADVYGFPDEASLVEAVQSGLHGDGPLLLRAPSLQVSVRRLLELRLEELALIEALERQGDDNTIVDVKTKRMLAANELWTQSDLAVGRDFVGDDLEPVFQSLGLADQVRLFNLVEEASTEAGLDANVQKEAKAFALERAIVAREFIDFYRLYVAVADGVGSGRGASAKRKALAADLVSALEPHLYGLLKCPFVIEDLTPAEMLRVARAWIAAGNRLGFSCVSHGLHEVVRYAGAAGLDPQAAAATVASYFDGARALVLAGEATSSELGQDGSTCRFRVESESAHGELAHTRHLATLTIDSLHEK